MVIRYFKMISKLAVFLLLMFTVLGVEAQDFEVSMRAPSNVTTGVPFRIEVSVNAQNVRVPDPQLKGFNYYGRSTSNSMSIINGDVTVRSSSIYTVSLDKAGVYTVPAISVDYNGKKYTSNSLTITASGDDVSNNSQAANDSKGGDSQYTPPSSTGDLFVDVNCNKSEVYVGEQILMTASVYSRYNITGVEDNKIPSFAGFWAQDVYAPRNISFDRKVINNTEYLYTVWHKKALFAQKQGTLEIEPYEIKFIVSDGWGFRTAKKTAKSKLKQIKVKALPSGKPDGFGGAVGSFSISVSADRTEVNLDEPLTVKLTVKGAGNFQLFETPKVDFPSAFEKFEPKSAENISAGANGISGTKTFSYMVIARQNGEFEIPPVKFSYFDPATKSYKTVESKPLNISVKGERDSTVSAAVSVIKSDVENLGSDIKFIKQGNVKLRNGNKKFFNSFEFWLFVILLLVIFAGVIALRYQQIKNNADIIGVKNRRAGKTSKKRLKKAAAFMKDNKKDEFYVEILSALWGYLSDKLSIPTADLTRDNVFETFALKGIPEESAKKFIGVLDTCEFEHYAPESLSHPLENIYKLAAEAIENLETVIK